MESNKNNNLEFLVMEYSSSNQDRDTSAVLARIHSPWADIISCGDGWLPIIITLDRELAKISDDYVIYQVKEKFGGLRFYAEATLSSEKFDQLIIEAESLAARTCEICGLPGEMRHTESPWYKTLCSNCAPVAGNYVLG